MFQQKSHAAYLNASVDGTTQIGLLIVAYNALANHLFHAGEACLQRDIAARCSASNRALLLLGQMESWADLLDDARLIASLKSFYQGLRNEILRLQNMGTPIDFERLSKTVLGVRAAWQRKEQLAHGRSSHRSESSQRIQSASSDQELVSASSGWCA